MRLLVWTELLHQAVPADGRRCGGGVLRLAFLPIFSSACLARVMPQVKRVRCESSGAMVPKDKAIKRFIVRNMVDASAIRDLQEACAIDGGWKAVVQKQQEQEQQQQQQQLGGEAWSQQDARGLVTSHQCWGVLWSGLAAAVGNEGYLRPALSWQFGALRVRKYMQQAC